MAPQILLLSEREIADVVAYCVAYEFEDVFGLVTGAQRIDVTDLPSLEFSRKCYKVVHAAFGSSELARQLAPHPRKMMILETDFDLFFPIFNHIYELYSLAVVPNWRQRCRKAACFITEVWSDQLPSYLIELLCKFDHIFVGSYHSVSEVARSTGRPCTYLPLAVDVPRFRPDLQYRPRPIWVCNIGRRSPVTHAALLNEAKQHQAFYYFDTVAASGSDRKQRTFRVDNPGEHREMLATLLKRSCYFIANRSYVNKPEFVMGRDEISSRFYEGAAAGALMIGEPPLNEEFKRQFDWPNAIIHMPFECPDIADILAGLNSNPAHLRAIRRRNAREAALRHDWLYQIRIVFDVFGFPYTEEMKARAKYLEQLALCLEKECNSRACG